MSFTRPNILLLSGYHAASHKFWCEQLVDGLPEFNWTQVALPDRHFYWRIRSNALSFAFKHPELSNDKYDLVLATSMVDLCNLRGLLPHLSQVPTVLYFHENQFVYPERSRDDPAQSSVARKQNSNLINAQLTTIYSALASDKLVFNSEYNKDTFFNGARALFEKMPDGTPGGMLDHLPQQSQVIPVPLRDDLTDVSIVGGNIRNIKTLDRPVEIVWNHRWEYDKQPQVFFAAIKKLLDDGLRLSVHVMGQSFREVPDCFTDFHNEHADVVSTWGHQPMEQYRQVLKSADIVVSAALHDFQGLGMLEAIRAGCIPVAPDRMAYPEYMPEELLYLPAAEDGVKNKGTINQESEAREVSALYLKLLQVINGDVEEHVLKDINTKRYASSIVLPQYCELLNDIIL